MGFSNRHALFFRQGEGVATDVLEVGAREEGSGPNFGNHELKTLIVHENSAATGEISWTAANFSCPRFS
jgi:hypothetical protein